MSAATSDTAIADLRGRPRRTLAAAGLAHALHDGFTDLIYVLLPVWQTQFGLSYGALAVLRSLYVGAMAALQMPAGQLARRWFGGRAVLVAGTALSAFGYVLAGLSGGLLGLGIALVLAGAGSSTQHPLASAAVSRAFGETARGPLGIYNFAGDVGKAALPATVALLLTFTDWRTAVWIVAGFGFAVAVAIRWLMPSFAEQTAAPAAPKAIEHKGSDGGGFALLFATGVLDSAVRMGFLLFLPFLLIAKGAALPTVGLALALVFIGGALGKAACGWLGDKLGLLATVVLTEAGTAAAILAVLALPLIPAIVVLPLLGIMLNGTSSVLYGTVPELVPSERIEPAFALFYTGTIGSSALAPVLFGLLGDAVGVSWATVAIAVTALATLPLVVVLAPRLVQHPVVKD